jgi:hypothetical protein
MLTWLPEGYHDAISWQTLNYVELCLLLDYTFIMSLQNIVEIK